MNERRILLADADAFFVAVARLIDPEVAGKEPLLVVGGSAEGRGVVTSASYETRAFGVRSGMPMAQALRLCPRLVRVPVPRRACSDKSRQIRMVLQYFTPVVEPASIDEFYLDLTGTEQLYGGATLAELAARIRRAVFEQTNISVSLGGGTSKFIAKLAAKQAKPHRGGTSGVMVVPPGEEAGFLADRELAEIPGVGPHLQERLAQHGLWYVRDALSLDEHVLMSWLGKRTGKWLHRRVRGIDTSPVVSHGVAKSLSHEETFARDLLEDGDLERELSRLAARLAADLRSKHICARTVTVKLRDADFTTRQASHTLAQPLDSDRTLTDVARLLLRRLREQRRTAARLIGVAVSNLGEHGGPTRQLSLFPTEEATGAILPREGVLTRAVDHINQRFGRERIVRASTVDPLD
jgi:DNA polymerase-4